MLKPFRRLETSVRQEPMVAQGDAQADGNPIEDHKNPKGRPAERPWSEYQPQVHRKDPQQRGPLKDEARGCLQRIFLGTLHGPYVNTAGRFS